ncbi:putative centrin, partial [Toxoplasma gondii TgCatPRC2]
SQEEFFAIMKQTSLY